MVTKITANDVIQSTEQIEKKAVKHFSQLELMLHEQGYHVYSTAVSNLRYGVEQAFEKFLRDMEDTE